MEKTEKLHFLDGTTLKLIAMVSMVFDHVGDNFFPDQVWMRVIGRIAMPIFAFCIAEGFSHTRDRKKYLLRMGVFAVLSELPFDLLTEGKPGFQHQNVMCTFFLAILALTAWDYFTDEKRSPGRIALGVCAVLGFMAAALLLRTDYYLYGVGLVFLFYVLRRKALWLRASLGMAYHLLCAMWAYTFSVCWASCRSFSITGKRGAASNGCSTHFIPAICCSCGC